MAITAENLQQLIQQLQPPPTPAKHFTHCPARFNGTRSKDAVDDFLDSVEFYKQSEGISDENALRGLALLLEGFAHLWWTGIKTSATTWENAKLLLRNEFAPRPPAYKIYQDVFASRQDENTPTGQFIAEKRSLLAQLETPLAEIMQLDMLYGLLTLAVRDKVPRESVNSFADLLTKARLVNSARTNPVTQEITPHQTKRTKNRCQFCRNVGHDVSVCRKKAASLRSTGNKENTPLASIPRSDTIKCYGCQRPGFIRRNCPSCNPTPDRQPALSFSFVSLSKQTRPAVHIQVDGITGSAFLDTGARTSLAGTSLYHLLRQRGYKFNTRTMDVTLADGKPRKQLVQIVTVPVTLQGRIVPTTFCAFPDAHFAQTLLGIDFIFAARLVLNFSSNQWHFDNDASTQHPFVPKDEDSSPPVLQSMDTDDCITLDSIANEYRLPVMLSPLPVTPTRPITPGLASAPLPQPTYPSELETMFSSDHQSGLADHYGPCIQQTATSQPLATAVSAPQQNPFSRHGYMLQDAYDAVDAMWDDSIEDTSLIFASLDLREDEASEFTSKQRQTMTQLLHDYNSVFALHGPATPFAEHQIATGDHAPLSAPPYRVTPQKSELLRQAIQELLDHDIIEECESAWAAPTVLVPKPGGGIRLCIDFRRLNAVTVADQYPLPNLDDLLHSTGNIGCISTMDLRAGYHQIRIKEEDKDKTCFVTPFCTYRFNRMPFGLRNAPATFQRLMDRFRRRLPDLRLLAYLDDLILLSDHIDDHLYALRRVFDMLREFQLRLHRPKCRFGCRKTRYLGHVISTQGIHTDPAKISAIQNFQAPRNAKQVITFLQTCSWYRKFIPQFAKLSQPLSKLTRQKEPWEWGSEQNKSFNKLKSALTSAPILRPADHGQPFTLRTDASAYAIGAALLQGEGVDERPVEYASRLLTAPERNYSTTEREALAIVWAVNRFRGYLEETSVIIVTDHQPLKWLMSLRSPSGRLARWALQLQPYNLQIHYTPGKANVVADTLSRPPQANSEDPVTDFNFISLDLPTIDASSLREAQQADPELKKILDAFNAGDQETTAPWTSRGYLCSQGILYRYSPDDDVEEAQLVIPTDLKTKILHDHHDASTAGHYGAERTLHKILQKFYWPGIRRDVTKYVKTCPECQKYKPSNQVPAGLLQTPVMHQRFEVLAIDLFGPLPESINQKKWILTLEDTASRWIELFPLAKATSEECAWTLVNEVCLRYGIPRRVISDNGPQFISSVMQCLTYCLGIDQCLTPVYHPAANPIERRHRDLKTQLAIQVGTDQTSWDQKLPAIRFAMNTARCQSTGYSPAYLTFGRELRTPTGVNHDLRAIVTQENFVPEVTPRLLRLADTLDQARETHEKEQNRRKAQADSRRRPSPGLSPGDYVYVTSHTLSSAAHRRSSKLTPKRDGPYLILRQQGPCSYQIARSNHPTEPIGVYHVSALTPYRPPEDSSDVPAPLPEPLLPIRRRGRPRKVTTPTTTEPSTRTIPRL